MAIQASGGNETPMGLGDSVYQRLLKERIIWLGGEVRDDNANAICAQLLLLAAEEAAAETVAEVEKAGEELADEK